MRRATHALGATTLPFLSHTGVYALEHFFGGGLEGEHFFGGGEHFFGGGFPFAFHHFPFCRLSCTSRSSCRSRRALRLMSSSWRLS